MSIKFLKAETLDNLYNSISENIDRYKNIGFDDILDDTSCLHIHDGLTFDYNKLRKISGKAKTNRERTEEDVENSKIIKFALEGMSPYLAKDERVWSFLCHSVLFQYTFERWPINKDWNDKKVIQHVKSHFFAKSDRDFERNNAASRLWWGAYFSSNVSNMDFDEAISSFHRNQDIRGHIIGRPTSSSSMNLFGALLGKFNHSYRKDKRLVIRENYQKFLKEVNLLGGRTLIPVMGKTEIDTHLDSIEQKVLGFIKKEDSKDELNEALRNKLVEFSNNTILVNLPDTPHENRILNDDRLLKFVAYKPTNAEQFCEIFDLEDRDNLDLEERGYLRDILKIIEEFVDDNFY
jgi:hypothetical protein